MGQNIDAWEMWSPVVRKPRFRQRGAILVYYNYEQLIGMEQLVGIWINVKEKHRIIKGLFQPEPLKII